MDFPAVPSLEQLVRLTSSCIADELDALVQVRTSGGAPPPCRHRHHCHHCLHCHHATTATTAATATTATTATTAPAAIAPRCLCTMAACPRWCQRLCLVLWRVWQAVLPPAEGIDVAVFVGVLVHGPE
jgi:hypothetical protein